MKFIWIFQEIIKTMDYELFRPISFQISIWKNLWQGQSEIEIPWHNFMAIVIIFASLSEILQSDAVISKKANKINMLPDS